MKKIPYKKFNISRLIPKIKQPHSIPGTIKYIGITRENKIKVQLFEYNKTTCDEKIIESISEIRSIDNKSTITWINISGVHDESIIHAIGDMLDIHNLVLEDIANTTQRPKVEEHDTYIFSILKMAYFDINTQEIILEQVSTLLGSNYLITLQENEVDVFDELRERLRLNNGKVRSMSSDYLLYAITDAIIDNYFSTLEYIGDKIENLEEVLINSPSEQVLHHIYNLKKELIFLRKSIWPMREVINKLYKIENKLITTDSSIYFRDIYDHTIQVMETIETFRDMTTSMLDLYLSTVSNKMNEVMKVLTLFAAIFIPLTFIAGVYGMNFEYMPELKMRLAYPIWWSVIIVISLAMIVVFKRKKWL